MRSRSFIVAATALVALAPVGCTAVSSDDVQGSSQPMLGEVWYAGCTKPEIKFLREAMRLGRIAATSDLFADCVLGALDPDSYVLGPPYLGQHYVGCDPDPFDDTTISERAYRVIQASRSPYATEIHCNGDSSSEWMGYTELGGYMDGTRERWWIDEEDLEEMVDRAALPLCPDEPSCMTNKDCEPLGENAVCISAQCAVPCVWDADCADFDSGPTFCESNHCIRIEDTCRDPGQEAYPEYYDTMANLAWHEGMHQHGYDHPTNSDSGVCDVPDSAIDEGWETGSDTIPYIVGWCIQRVIERSAASCDGFASACGPFGRELLDNLEPSLGADGDTVWKFSGASCRCVTDPLQPLSIAMPLDGQVVAQNGSLALAATYDGSTNGWDNAVVWRINGTVIAVGANAVLEDHPFLSAQGELELSAELKSGSTYLGYERIRIAVSPEPVTLQILNPVMGQMISNGDTLELHAIAQTESGAAIPIDWYLGAEHIAQGDHVGVGGIFNSVGGAYVRARAGETEAEVVIVVTNEVPEVSILSPTPGTTVLSGQPIALMGTSFDLDSVGSLPIEWTASGVPIGEGSSLVVTLPTGNHNVVARVVDELGAVAETSTYVRVFARRAGLSTGSAGSRQP